MIKFLISKDVISRFATYLMGRESPCYNQYSGKMENWDLTRPTPTNIDSLLEMMHNIYKKSQLTVVISEEEVKNVFYLLITF